MTRFALVLALLSSSSIAFAQTPAVGQAPAPAPQPAPRGPAEISIEITNTNAKVPGFTGSISLAFGDCASVESGTGDAHYDLKVCYTDHQGTDMLGLDVERTVHTATNSQHEKLTTSTHIAHGQRVVVGRFGTGSDMTEIAATIS
jgi:hypothetical protein